MAQNDFETTPVVTEVENFETAVSRGDRNGGVGETVIPTKLYVKRIPESVTSKELNDLFAAYGSVTECAIIRSYAFIVRRIRCLLLLLLLLLSLLLCCSTSLNLMKQLEL